MLAAPPGPVRTSLSATAVAIAGYLCLFGSLALQPNDEWRIRTGMMGEFFVHQISPWFYAFSVFLTGRKKQIWLAKMAPLIGFGMTVLVFHMKGLAFHSFWWGMFLCRPGATAFQLVIYYGYFFGFMLFSFYNFIVAVAHGAGPDGETSISNDSRRFFQSPTWAPGTISFGWDTTSILLDISR